MPEPEHNSFRLGNKKTFRQYKPVCIKIIVKKLFCIIEFISICYIPGICNPVMLYNGICAKCTAGTYQNQCTIITTIKQACIFKTINSVIQYTSIYSFYCIIYIIIVCTAFNPISCKINSILYSRCICISISRNF